ncbi:MAG: S41 family peptidase [Chloroflexota bacterium]
MKKQFLSLSLIIAATLILAACSSPTPTPIVVVETVAVTAPPTSTPTLEPSATTEPTATKKPLVGPMATAAALSAQVTMNPPTPVGGFDTSDLQPDDYVGITKQAWHIINANYVRDNFNGADWDAIYDQYVALAEDVSTSEELWVLLADLVHELNDSHSRFVPPGNMEREFGVETSDSAEPSPWTGIGVWPGPSREDEYFLVWDVCSNSPAAEAGIQRGDIVLAIDGEPVEREDDGFTRAHSRAVAFGTGGDSVVLNIWSGPDQEPRDVEVGFDIASGCDTWRHEIVKESPRIGYVRVIDFDGNSAHEIESAINDMEKKAPLDGLIVDIRHNPGGNSDESIAVFTEGIVGTVGPLREGKTRTAYRIRGPVVWNTETPVVVLTDGSSHSAADYFPAAMKELGRATILGMNSAGNTEGIISFGLADGTLIRLAVMTMALNDGTILEGIGVTPDVIVPLGQWGLRQQPYDAQLQAAIDFLK